MGDEGEVICLDLNGGKARMVRENAKRLGLASLRVVVGNARDAPALLGRRPIDRVLVDVPCSNTGVLRRRPEARWRLREDDIGRLARNGLALLSSAASVVRPGGTIVYSTCSIEPEENEHVVSLFLRTSAGFSLDKELKFLPHKDGCDGGYGAGLIRR
jgi:16S rRNA (cytosine967-C5)-methyltransferase